MTHHITVVTRRSDRRIMGKLGERKNLCGGPFTDRDITIRDARRMSVIESQEWDICDACIAILQRREHEAVR